LRFIKKKTLDDLSKKLDRAEGHAKEIEQINSNAEEAEKLQRFGLYHCVRMEKYLRQGGDPMFGNLDGVEYTAEEFEYHLSHMLNDYTPEERYGQMKEAYYFHPSYIEMEKLDYWRDRAKAKYCDGHQCIPDCPYFEENGRIEDEQVIKEFIQSTEILEIEDYEKELGKELVQTMINEWNSSGS
jgi:hypothetical protein